MISRAIVAAASARHIQQQEKEREAYVTCHFFTRRDVFGSPMRPSLLAAHACYFELCADIVLDNPAESWISTRQTRLGIGWIKFTRLIFLLGSIDFAPFSRTPAFTLVHWYYLGPRRLPSVNYGHQASSDNRISSTRIVSIIDLLARMAPPRGHDRTAGGHRPWQVLSSEEVASSSLRIT